MNLRQLDYFLRTADLCSLSRASEELGISQSGLSKSIQALEDEVRAPLFVRRSRGVELTQFGHTFHRHAITIRAQMRNTLSDLEALTDGQAGTLVIGTSVSSMFTGFEQLILAFKAEYPNVQLRIVFDIARRLLDSLANGELDIVFSLCESAQQRTDIDVMEIEKDEQGLVVRKGHPLTIKRPQSLEDLDKYGWVLPEQGTLFRRRLDVHYVSAGREVPRPVIESFSRPFMISMVAQTDHIGIASRYEIETNAPGKIEMLEYPFTWFRTIGIMRRRDETPSVILNSLIECAQVALRAPKE